jgi:hypothetical protein
VDGMFIGAVFGTLIALFWHLTQLRA